ncbi:ribonuclease H family protein [Brucella intermedia]|uniref:ribonuclease H family protein n=1 Tax=Brucella intermedia TaxID=94625 RepID=UPI00224A94B8|nr:ribonuclease H [Brucella intermedia]
MKFQAPLTIEADSPEEAEALRLKVFKILGALPIELGDLAPAGTVVTPTGTGVIEVYTDGGCDLKKDGLGAWAYVIKFADGQRVEHTAGEFGTTNNRMEMVAVIRALEAIEIGQAIKIYSDSEYLIKGCTQWARNWVNNGWKTYQGKDVINRDLWEILLALYQLHDVTFEWVKGHAGVEENERCDQLCTQTMQELHKAALSEATKEPEYIVGTGAF